MTADPPEILLVEDNPNDVELALYAFRKKGLADCVHVVRDGAEALDFLAHCGAGALPRLVLLDLKLPRFDGLETLRKIKTGAHTRFLPVVVLTSSLQECDIESAYRLGANSYIVKPIDFDQFIEVAGILGIYWLRFNQPTLK